MPNQESKSLPPPIPWRTECPECQSRLWVADPEGNHLEICRLQLEQTVRQRDAALKREAAIIQFCEAEMGWEFFRAEFQIGDNPSKSLENAMKLRKFLSENA